MGLTMPNFHHPEWVERTEAPLRDRTARVDALAGAERLGATLYEIDPQQNGSPFHFHHANEEMIIVLSGRPTLRTLDGSRPLNPVTLSPALSVEQAHINCRTRPSIASPARSIHWPIRRTPPAASRAAFAWASVPPGPSP
jgi:hypothetical protein